MGRKTFCKLLLILGILSAGMVLYIWEQVTVGDLARKVDLLFSERERLQQENKRLRADIARLSRSDRIKKIATEKLGMVAPATPPSQLVIDVRGLEDR
ncbi:MAG TPA: cell division protein FtsL [Candidatus Latescibacteria bacterium]|nr:cell division protein FtsL [Candidatus Latescibacterota bacterium]